MNTTYTLKISRLSGALGTRYVAEAVGPDQKVYYRYSLPSSFKNDVDAIEYLRLDCQEYLNKIFTLILVDTSNIIGVEIGPPGIMITGQGMGVLGLTY